MDAAVTELLLKAMTDWESDPALTQEEIDALLASAALADSFGNAPTNQSTSASSWASGTVLVGTVIVDASGRYWRAVIPGATNGTQPSWPSLGSTAPGAATVIDGTVTWLDVGTAWAPTYSLDAAAAMGWRIKAGRAAARYGFMTDGQQFSRQQVVAQCLVMARAYERRTASSVVIEGAPSGVTTWSPV